MKAYLNNYLQNNYTSQHFPRINILCKTNIIYNIICKKNGLKKILAEKLW